MGTPINVVELEARVRVLEKLLGVVHTPAPQPPLRPVLPSDLRPTQKQPTTIEEILDRKSKECSRCKCEFGSKAYQVCFDARCPHGPIQVQPLFCGS